MADIARLEKVLDRVEGLCTARTLMQPPGDSPLPLRRSWLNHWGAASPRDQQPIWFQGDWTMGTEEGLTVTDQGLVDKEGHVCGAAGCFAGWAVYMFAPPGTMVCGSSVKVPGRRMRTVWGYAAELLGLTRTQAENLFGSANTIETLRKLTAAIADREQRKAQLNQ